MQLEQARSESTDYLAPGIKELSAQRGGQGNDPQNGAATADTTMTRDVARRLIPACIVTPALLWFVLHFGQTRGWYELDTCLILFLFSVTLAFGGIVCLNLRRLGRLDAERAAAEEQTKRARDAAESANRFKSAFFANISHEIRTPLTAINGFAELMLHPKRTAAEKESDLRVIRRNGEHLLTLINDILDLSKIEAGKMHVERIICSPATILGEVCSMLRPRATQKGLTLDLKFKGKISKTILCDPTRLRQIFINLISNAVKFTSQGSVCVEACITPSLADPNPFLQVTIADTGMGIAPDRKEALFEPFVQGDASITRQFGGTGLGLTISRHFCRALGGDITVESEPGKGSTFTVTVETGSLAGVELQARPEEATDHQVQSQSANICIKGSVLVAEDGIDNQALIATRLRQTGLTVEIASNGKIACEKALAAIKAEQPFDLILMDVQMPVMDGFSATLNLRTNGYRGPIIALTANAMERDRDKCLNAGCNDFVTKPIQMDKLFQAMGRYMTVEQVKDEAAKSDPKKTDDREAQKKSFDDNIATWVEEMDECVDREDRQRLTELVQLVMAKAAAAGLKDVAAQSARLMQSAEGGNSWTVLKHAVREFAKEAMPNAQAGAV